VQAESRQQQQQQQQQGALPDNDEASAGREEDLGDVATCYEHIDAATEELERQQRQLEQ